MNPPYEKYLDHHNLFIDGLEDFQVPIAQMLPNGDFQLDDNTDYRAVWKKLPCSEEVLSIKNALEKCSGNIDKMQESESGLAIYFSNMENASIVLRNLFHSSLAGAENYNSPTNTFRVSLEDKDKMTEEKKAKFEKSLHIPLDDNSPLLFKPSMTKEEFNRFFSGVEAI